MLFLLSISFRAAAQLTRQSYTRCVERPTPNCSPRLRKKKNLNNKIEIKKIKNKKKKNRRVTAALVPRSSVVSAVVSPSAHQPFAVKNRRKIEEKTSETDGVSGRDAPNFPTVRRDHTRRTVTGKNVVPLCSLKRLRIVQKRARRHRTYEYLEFIVVVLDLSIRAIKQLTFKRVSFGYTTYYEKSQHKII